MATGRDVRRRSRALPALLSGLVVALLPALTLLPAPPARAQLEAGVRAQVPPAIVQIGVTVRVTENDVTEEQLVVRGSGSIVSPDGLILTNDHVIELADLRTQLATEQAQLERQGRSRRLEVVEDRFVILAGEPDELAAPRFQATIVDTSPALDLAVLRIDRDATGAALDPNLLNLPYLQLGDSDTVELGEAVHLFGYPAVGSGLLTYTQGTVSSFDLAEKITGRAWIKTDATVSGGSSGGGAVNDQGQLIGIPTQAGAIECRPGDTNGDGAVDELDIGCVPIGGTLNQLRPVNLAKPLLAGVCAVCDPVARQPPARATLTIAEGGLAVPYRVDTAESPPVLVTTPDGGAAVIFAAEVESTTWAGARKLWVARFDPVRGRWLPADALPGGPVQLGPAAVVDSEGVIHLVYAERAGDRPDDLATLMYTRSFGQGLWQPPVPVSPHPDAGNQLRPALAVDADDRLYLIWQEARTIPAADRLIYPERGAVVFSEQRAGAWSLPRELKALVGYDWLRLVVAGNRLIAMWTLEDRGVEYLGWASRRLEPGAGWIEPDQTLTGDEGDGLPLMLSGGRDLLGDPRIGEAVLATGQFQPHAAPVQVRILAADATGWGQVTPLVTYPKPENGDPIDNLSVVRGPDDTIYTIFEHGPLAGREVTVIPLAAGATLPGVEAVLTAGDPGPQRHQAAAIATDGALWVVASDLEPESPEAGPSPLRVHRWLPSTTPLPLDIQALLPDYQEVPSPLGPGLRSGGPIGAFQEMPRLAGDPAAAAQRLSEDWLMRAVVLAQFDASRPPPLLREVSIDRFDSADGAVAALDFLLQERVAAGAQIEVLAPLACLSGEGVQRFVQGPSLLPQLPDGEEITMFYQWENLLIRLTEVSPPGTATPLLDAETAPAFSSLPCPLLPIDVRPRLRLAGQGQIPLTEALPTAAELRMLGESAEARTREDLLAAGPDRPLDAWGWRENVTRTFTDPQTGLLFLETEIVQLGGPEYAAEAATYLADDWAAAGALTEAEPPAALATMESARVLAGPAIAPEWSGSFEATIFVQDHELLYRVTAIAAREPPVAAATEVMATMLAKRPPAVSPAAAQR